MKTIFMSLRHTRIAVVFLLLGAFTAMSCQKDNSGSPRGFEGIPRTEVPDPFVGTYMYVTSTGGYVDQYGNHIPGVAQGITLTINRDGTGSSLYHVETGSYTGSVTTDEVRCQCTYEITKTSETTANIIIHYVSGKNYHNGVLLHDLDASKLYPNGDAVWNDCQYGTNSQGAAIFIVGSGDNAAQFTRQ